MTATSGPASTSATEPIVSVCVTTASLLHAPSAKAVSVN